MTLASSEASLVSATWALVLVTLLLVLVTTVPTIIERRRERQVLALGFVPEMHILKSRIDGSVITLLRPEELSEPDVDRIIEYCDEDIEMLYPLTRLRISMLFSNELYVCRHLLTQAGFQLRNASLLFEGATAEEVRERDRLIREACAHYRAASVTLASAEAELPNRVTRLGDETFSDRFRRISRDRVREAERWAVDQRND